MAYLNVHFPTDVNLLWDAQRKCADLLVPMAAVARLAGRRKCQDWRRRLKGQMIGLADRLLGRYGSQGLASRSFDRGFTREADSQLLELYIPEVIMRKRGKGNSQEPPPTNCARSKRACTPSQPLAR